MNARMLVTRAVAAGAALRAAVCTTLCTASRTCLCIFLCAFLPATSALAQTGDAQPYTVSEGSKVDAHTLSGWRTWRALACERCHGAAQEGMVGPSLVNSLKVLSKDQFKEAVLKGRIDKGMPNFDGSKMVVENIDNLYAYLKGRSDGAIQPGRLQEIGK